MKMQRSDEKLCLQWNDFRDNVSSAFGNLREDKEFTDVTLVCEDGQQVEAHKVVLISSSPFFLNLLKRNKHPHPLVYMRNLKYENLLSMVDFLYHGEANVHQENLDTFLAMADELQLKGLEKREEDDFDTVSNGQIPQESETTNNPIATSKDKKPSPGLKDEASKSQMTETDIALKNTSTDIVRFPSKSGLGNLTSTDLVELDQKVKSMMTTSENRIGKHQILARKCNVCGKEGEMRGIMNHIEANHLTNISISCNFCEKTLQTRAALLQHNRKNHSQ